MKQPHHGLQTILLVLDTLKIEDESAAKTFFHHHGLQVNFCPGERYVGGFLGSKADRAEYVKEKIQAWADGVKILSSIAKRFPQTVYAELTISLHAEWQQSLT